MTRNFIIEFYFSYSAQPILRNPNRYRRDQRQLEEEEEIWFSEEDDFADVPTTKVEFDTSIGIFFFTYFPLYSHSICVYYFRQNN